MNQRAYGDRRRCARVWAAGEMFMHEFQSLMNYGDCYYCCERDLSLLNGAAWMVRELVTDVVLEPPTQATNNGYLAE